MNKFNCFNNMQISRYAAIKYAQLMAFSNLSNLFNAATNQQYGVLTSIGCDGLIPETDAALRVSRKIGSEVLLEIQPGVAVTPAGDIAVNPTVSYIDVTDYATGLYNLYIKTDVLYGMTGEETFYTGHNSSTVGTLEMDSCEFTLTADTLDEVLLATVFIPAAGKKIPDNITAIATLPEDTVIYPNTATIAFAGITGITGGGNFSSQPYMRIDSEYLHNTGADTWDRGALDTNAVPYYEGSYNAVWSPIVDMRQTNALRLSLSIGSLEELKSGLFKYGSDYRHLDLRSKKDAPTMPVLDVTKASVIWLNSHLAAGYLTADMIAAYEEIQGVQTSINNTLALINQLKIDYAEAAGDTTSQERLENEIEHQEYALLDYRNQEATLALTLSTKTMDSISNNDIRKFAYMVVIEEPEHNDDIDEPVQYEVEVEYAVVDSPALNSTITRKQWFYSRRRNIDSMDWRTMERTYEGLEDTDGLFSTILIPISFGERIRYRVRAIGESGAVSEFTSYANYSFTGYATSQQYMMVSNIYSILHPDPYKEGIITQELVSLLKSFIDDFNDYVRRVGAIEDRVTATELAISDLETTV